MTDFLPFIADLDSRSHLESAIVGIVVAAALGFFVRAGQKGPLVVIGFQKVIQYSSQMRIAVIVGWVATVGLAVFAALGDGGGNLKSAACLFGFFGVLLLPLHLEAFGASITWDETNIYTRSAWRRARKIPFQAVQSCDFSPSMQWYRIRTNGHGIIRVHAYMCGIPEILRVLPCATPGYPPVVA